MLKIDACIIVKNEEPYIKSLVENLDEFCDTIYITDTGSTDKTLEILETLSSNNKKVVVSHFKWVNDFSAARNFSFSQSKDSDYIFWCDGSDDFTKGLMMQLKAFKRKVMSDSMPDLIEVIRKYDDLLVGMYALVKRSAGLEWHDPIHEFIDYKEDTTIKKKMFTSDALLIHRNFDTRDEAHANRNIEIFRSMDKEHKKFTSRNLMYYANELFDHDMLLSAYLMYQEAMRNYDNFLSPGEVILCFVKMCVCYNVGEKRNNLDDLISKGEKLYNHGYKNDLFLACLGDLYFAKNEWKKAIRVYEEALVHKNNEMFLTELIAWNIDTLYIKSQLLLIYTTIEEYGKANEVNEQVLKSDPKNEIALKNREYFKSKIWD